MRLTPLLNRVYPPWKFTYEEREVRFKPQLGVPLKLRNKVVLHQNAPRSHHCLQEMYNMMACLKKNEFGESSCSKEIELFQKCNKLNHEVTLMSSMAKVKAARQRKQGSAMTTDEMSAYLRKYPQKFD